MTQHWPADRIRIITMPFFGRKNQRKRASRLSAIGASQGLLARIGVLRDRNVAARFLLCFLAMFVLTCVVEGWKSPFAHRLGDRSEHGILATVDFERVDADETERRRNGQESRVPLFLRRSNLDIGGLTDRLRTDLQAIVDADDVSELDANLRESLGLVSPVDQSLSNDEISAQFQDLQHLILAKEDEPMDVVSFAERLEVLLAEAAKLVEEIDRLGVMHTDEISKQRIRRGQRLVVVDDDGTETAASLSDIDLNIALKENGRVFRLWDSVPLLQSVRPRIESWLLASVKPTLRFDRSRTRDAQAAARASVEPVPEKWRSGDVLVGPDDKIDSEDLALLWDEHQAADKEIPLYLKLVRAATVFLMILVLTIINAYYLNRNEPQLIRSFARLAMFFIAIIGTTALCRWFAAYDLRGEVVPIVVLVMVYTIAYNQVMAALVSLSVSLIVTLATVGELSQFVIFMSISATSIMLLNKVAARSKLITVGFATAITYLLVFCGMEVLRSSSISILWSEGDLIIEGLKGAGWCFAAGFLVAGGLPFIESAFGVITDISLLELSNISHPLLHELVQRAPGTYNHSITVASIAEPAADGIGANGLLVRVGAYFHDIGKMLKPEYFVENVTEGQESRHENLAPEMSTLIIIGHVKDGIDMARRHHLPQRLVDFVEQHHGTTLVSFFFHAANKIAEAEEDKQEVNESSFRYPGPKPQTREAGVMLLADAVESASRTLSDPTPKRIETLVHRIAMDRLLDGQFEESGLTLSELRIIEDSLTKSLTALYHGRIKYPEQPRSAS
jgi:putative nucleotidyltransferase with HDIG domain